MVGWGTTCARAVNRQPWRAAPFRRLGVSSRPKAQVRVTSEMYNFWIVFGNFEIVNKSLHTSCDLNIKLEVHSYDFNPRSLCLWRLFLGPNWPWSFQMVSSWCSTLSLTWYKPDRKWISVSESEAIRITVDEFCIQKASNIYSLDYFYNM